MRQAADRSPQTRTGSCRLRTTGPLPGRQDL